MVTLIPPERSLILLGNSLKSLERAPCNHSRLVIDRSHLIYGDIKVVYMIDWKNIMLSVNMARAILPFRNAPPPPRRITKLPLQIRGALSSKQWGTRKCLNTYIQQSLPHVLLHQTTERITTEVQRKRRGMIVAKLLKLKILLFPLTSEQTIKVD